jgi:hypothetical protein
MRARPTVQRILTALGMTVAVSSLAVSTSGQGPAAGAVVAQGAQTQTPAATTMTWTPSRLPDGQPDVQGFWAAVITGTHNLTNPMTGGAEFNQRIGGPVVRNPSRIVDPPDGQVPYQAWAAAKQKQQAADMENPTKIEHVDTQNRCLLGGVPRPFYNTEFRILQPPGAVVFVWDDYHSYRVVPLDGRPHVGPSVKLWMGDSRGHWEGNTLVVDVTNLNAKFRLSIVGDFFSEKAHIVERLTFLDANTMNYEATIEDPTVFTRPWMLRVAEKRIPDYEIWEFACHEGERSQGEMLLGGSEKR